MAKRYTILQKKLKDLESLLNQALSLPPNTPCHQTLSQDIQQRFLFFNNLLSAELSSRPTNPFHIQHIANRVLELQAAFNDWDTFQSSGLDHVENGSACSCTESCLNDDPQAAADEGSSELISLSDLEQAAEASTEMKLVGGLDFQGFKEQDEAELEHVEKHEMSEREEEDRVEEAKRSVIREQEEESNGVRFGSCLAPLASGVLIGMILMAVFMVIFSGCFTCYEVSDYTHSLSPT